MGSAISQTNSRFSEDKFIVVNEPTPKVKQARLMNSQNAQHYFDMKDSSNSSGLQAIDSITIANQRANRQEETKLQIVISLSNADEKDLFIQQVKDLLRDRGSVENSKSNSTNKNLNHEFNKYKKSQFFKKGQINPVEGNSYSIRESMGDMSSSSDSGPQITDSLEYDLDSFELMPNPSPQTYDRHSLDSININLPQIIISHEFSNPPLYQTRTKSLFHDQAVKDGLLDEMKSLDIPQKQFKLLTQRAASLKVLSKGS